MKLPSFHFFNAWIAQFKANPGAKLSEPRLSTIGLIIGIILVVCGQILRTQDGATWVSLVILIAGLGLFGGSLAFGSSTKKFSEVFHLPSSWLGIDGLQLLLLIAAPIFSVVAYQFAGNQMLMRQPALAVGCWLIAILFVILGTWDSSTPHPRWVRKDLLIALDLTILALALRAYNTAHIPMSLSGDEASSGLGSVAILKGLENNIFTTGWFSFPRLFFTIQTLSIMLFGPTTPGLRLLSAFVGALTVGALYLVVHSLFNRWIALASAFFLAVMNFHIHFSRIGLNDIWDGLFVTICIGALWGAWKNHSRLLYILCGFSLGLSQYFYTSSHTLILLIPLIYLGLIVIKSPFSDNAEGKTLPRRILAFLPNLIIIYWVAAVIILPLALFYIQSPDDFMAPMNRVSLNAEWFMVTAKDMNTSYAGVMLNQFVQSIRAYTEIQPHEWYDARTPILMTLPAIFFFLGVVIVLVRKYWVQAWLIFCWLATITFINALSQDTPAAQRYIAALPVLAILVGCGVVGLSMLFYQFWPGSRILWIVMAVAVMAWVGWNEFHQYFLVFAQRSFFDENTLTAQLLANYLDEKPNGTEVCFMGAPIMGYDSINSLAYLVPQIHGRNCTLPFGTENNPLPVKGKTIFVALPNREAELKVIQNTYPGGKMIRYSGIDRETLMWIYDQAP